MTQNPDGTEPDDPREGRPDGSAEGGRKLDEDAAWRAIVENYGEQPSAEAPPPADRPAPAEPPPPGETLRWRDPLDSEATWSDEGHFVPPQPPPVPAMEPRRKLAWIGLFGSPVLMLAAVVLGWNYPGWVMGTLVIGFVGGFGYLVATMPRNRPDDWSGDDGAVV